MITTALAFQIPKIAIDPAPENLINSFEGQARWVNENFRRTFGDSSRVLVVLVSGDDVLSTPALQFQHDIALHFREHPRIEKVEGLTVLSVPRRVPAPPAPEQAPLAATTALTTAAGFGALVVCRFAGLVDIGKVGALGSSVGLLCAFVVIPAGFRPFARRG